jgi:glycosyltransferase involved in cell wall biosynthesis
VGLDLSSGKILPVHYAPTVYDTFGHDINQILKTFGYAPVSGLPATGIAVSAPSPRPKQRPPHISVIVATRNRTASLARCLKSILAVDYPNFDIIVIDNAPKGNQTETYIRNTYGHDPAVKYIRENEPGLSIAHNRGLESVTAPLVAFTDDDVEVDRNWLTAVVEPFLDSQTVGCVTGMIFPAQLETKAQILLEAFSGFGKGFNQQRYNLKEHRPRSSLFPYAPGMFGSGANMAFRTRSLRAIGGFDGALGAGSKGVGGDDLAAFFDMIMRGYTLVYEPAAIVRHYHRDDYASLKRTAYGYGVGLTAFLTKCLVDDPRRLLDILCRIPLGIKHLLHSESSKNVRKKADYPGELNWLERKGMLYGPVAYLRGRRYVRNRGCI